MAGEALDLRRAEFLQRCALAEALAERDIARVLERRLKLETGGDFDVTVRRRRDVFEHERRTFAQRF